MRVPRFYQGCHKFVALKRMKDSTHCPAAEQEIKEFFKEAEVMRQCRHPFVAPEPKPAFAMELLGISLQEACHNGLIGDEWLRVSFRQGRAKRDPCAF